MKTILRAFFVPITRRHFEKPEGFSSFNNIAESLGSSEIKEKFLRRFFKSVFLPVFRDFFNNDF